MVAQCLSSCSGGKGASAGPSANVKLKRWTDEDEDVDIYVDEDDELPSASLIRFRCRRKMRDALAILAQHRVTR